MSTLRVCVACRIDDCSRCIPLDPPRDKNGLVGGAIFLGGTRCPCRHTDEDRAEWRRREDEAFRRWFGKGEI